MITSSTIYWLTRLPYINSFLFAGCAISSTITLLASIVFLLAAMELDSDNYSANNTENEKTKDKKSVGKVKNVAIFAFFVSAFCGIGAVLVPSNLKEISAIYLLPKIANNKDINQIPNNTAKLLNTKLKAWINDNLEAKKPLDKNKP